MATWQLWLSGVGPAELTYGRLAAGVAAGASGVVIDGVEALGRYAETGLHQGPLGLDPGHDLRPQAVAILAEMAADVREVAGRAAPGRQVEVAVLLPPALRAEELVQDGLTLVAGQPGRVLIGLAATAQGTLAAARLLEAGQNVWVSGLASPADLGRLLDGAARAIRRADPEARPTLVAMSPGVWPGLAVVAERLQRIGEPVDALATATLRALLRPYVEALALARGEWASSPELGAVRLALVLADREVEAAPASWWRAASGWQDELVLAPAISATEQVRQALEPGPPDGLVDSEEELEMALLGRDLKLSQLTGPADDSRRDKAWHQLLGRWQADQRTDGRIQAGALAQPVQETAEAMVGDGILARLIAPPTAPAGALAAADRLGWIGLPGATRRQLGEVARLRQAVWRDGFTHLLVLADPASGRSQRLWTEAAGAGAAGLIPSVLDGTSPGAVGRLATSLPASRTLILVVSKPGEGSDLEDLLSCFQPWLERHLGRNWPGAVVAITDPGTPLAVRAQDERWRWLGLLPPQLSEPYAALGLAGALPLALVGHDPAAWLEEAEAQAEALRAGEAAGGLELGALLTAAAVHGRRMLTIYTDSGQSSWAAWLAGLFTTSRQGRALGLVPVIGEAAREAYGKDRLFVSYASEDPFALHQLAEGGHPIARFSLGGAPGLGREVMRWQAAVALAAEQLADSAPAPGAQAASQRLPPALARRVSLRPEEALAELVRLLAARPELSLVQVRSYLDPEGPERELTAELGRLLATLSALPVSWADVPLGTEGAGAYPAALPAGLLLQLLAQPAEEPIPGRPYGFGARAEARAAAEREALAAEGWTVMTVALGESAKLGLEKLFGSLPGGRR